MATITTTTRPYTSFDFTAPYWWSTKQTDRTATTYAVYDDLAAIGFTGRFTYDANQKPSGTATTVDFEDLSGAVYSVTGVQLSMSTVSTYLDNPNGGPSFMAHLLAGNDTINSHGSQDTVAGFAGSDRINLSVVGGRADGGSGTDTLAFAIAAGHGVNASLLFGRATDLSSGASMTLAGFEHLVGSSGNDVLQGNASANRIDGGSGAVDLVSYAAVATAVTVNLATGSASGGGGSDTLVGIEGAIGGKAADRLVGSAGANWLEGGTGVDTMSGGLGNDTYVAEATDVLVETADGGTDTIRSLAHWTLGTHFENLVLTGASALHGTGNALANRIDGNDAANLLDGGTGRDTLAGGLGNDTYVLNDLDTIIEFDGGGIDTVQCSISYTLAGGVEKLMLTGSANLTGAGNALDNTLQGNAGANVLDGKDGADTLIGGLGNDTYVVGSQLDLCTETSSGGIDTVKSGADRYWLGANVENLVLVNSGQWALQEGHGNSGNNRITGSALADLLEGGAGADTLAGGLGDDLYQVDATDVLVEAAGAGTDQVHAFGSYTLGANLENLYGMVNSGLMLTGNALDNLIVSSSTGDDTLDGGIGADTLKGSWGDNVYILGTDDTLIDEGGVDEVRIAASWTVKTAIENATLLGSGDFNLTGNSAANVLRGNAGDNVLDGSSGIDTLIGGAGDDTYYITAYAEYAIENVDEGNDTLFYNGTGSAYAWANIENLVLGTAATDGYGNDTDNRITGNALANVIWGGTGADTMVGGAGIDTYYVDNVGDQIVETNPAEVSHVKLVDLAHWTLSESMGAGSLSIDSSSLKDHQLGGNSHANRITANLYRADNDTLDGGGGADTMSGYDGNDTYHVDQAGDLVSESATGGNDTVIASLDYTLRTYCENLGLSGDQDINATGNGVDNLIWGNSGSNVLNGGSGVDTVSYAMAGHAVDANLGAGTATGWGQDTLISFDHLVGSDFADRLKGSNAANTITGGDGADQFSLDGGQLLAADLFTDFGHGADRLEVRQNTLAIGNGDTVIDMATTISSPGGYSSSAELVVVDALIEGSITASAVAAALGRANSGFSVGQTMLVAVHNASDAAVYQFKSSGSDWSVSSAELTRLTLLKGSAGLEVADFLFSAG